MWRAVRSIRAAPHRGVTSPALLRSIISPSVSRKNILRSLFPSFSTSSNGKTDALKTLASPNLDPQTRLVNAASTGDMPTLKRLVEDEGVNVNVGDYDHRTALHLAAAEAQMEALEYLLARGADLNAKDRWGSTPLEDAIDAKHRHVIRFLRERGATFPQEKDVVGELCHAASLGQVDIIDLLVEAGADVNVSDYDKRTPLHLAASDGQVQVVEWLLRNKANINAVDRFGNTPLQDAERGTGRNFRVIAQIFREHGAAESGVRVFSGVDLRSSIQDSLPMLCERWGWHLAECWLPSKDGQEFVATSWHVDKENSDALRPLYEGRRQGESTQGGAVQACLESKKAQNSNIDAASLGDKYYRAARDAGVVAGAVIPVLDQDGHVAAVMRFFSRTHRTLGETELEQMSRFSARMIRAGLYGPSLPAEFDPPKGIPEGQMNEVFQRIVSEGVFNPSLVYHEVDWFYNLGLQSFYFHRFDISILANHIHSYIAAKKFATTTGSPEDIWLHIENNPKLLGPGGPQQALYMIPVEHAKLVAVERNLVRRIGQIPVNKPYNLEFFSTEHPHIPGSSKKLGIYVLQTHTYANPGKFGSTERNIWEVASNTFLREKSKFIRERYQDILNEALDRLSPVVRAYERYKDGTIPVMFAFSQRSGAMPDHLLSLTELLKQMKLTATRKFIETFANGIIVYSLYLKPAPEDTIEQLLQSFGMLHLVPQSGLTKFFLKGVYAADEYTYCSAASRFVYYFINQRSEDLEVLAETFKTDPLNLGRLRSLATTLKREAVSVSRIHDCLERHPTLVKMLFDDFRLRAVTDTRKRPIPAENEDNIRKAIERDTDTLDGQILRSMLQFNTAIRKTNLYKKRKSALSFRLDPSFLKQQSLDWPVVPFGLFFIMSADFQGFHIRFQDVARGGIRIIRSATPADYQKNLSTLFAENYGLAYTQNKKNKDIPEFGSKGCILLNPERKEDSDADKRMIRLMCFQKYCSGVLDLLIPHEEVIDNYGKEEILFFGPDEYTADFMEWACQYAKSKGYPYWRAFTTGKPPSMGGIPHDTFGMTTRSVHRYVVKTLEKFGLDETKVTKIQTGGPDGDLGSNEIRISKDKTKAVVDGSGVLYDPEGINRTELVRLAEHRLMIDHFDASKLSSGGFKVLVRDSNITLPSGEWIDNGKSFRDHFHLHPLAAADLFVPCGGRPNAINLSNVRQLIDNSGKPRWRILIEGANLFLTQDARMVLEDAGVVLYKDASTNKGGVTSSSLEVFAALSMTDREFSQHMCVTKKNRPEFYNLYVQEIHQRIEADAEAEWACIWREAERTDNYRYQLTDIVSDKINTLNLFVNKSSLYDNTVLRKNVLKHAIPKILQQTVGLDTIIQRVPENYLRSIFSAYLASRYVYKFGVDANEFAFFEFIQPYLSDSTVVTTTPSIPHVPTTPVSRV